MNQCRAKPMRRFYILSLCTIATLVCASVNSNATAHVPSGRWWKLKLVT